MLCGCSMTTVQTFHFVPFQNDDDFIIEANIIIIKNDVDCRTLSINKQVKILSVQNLWVFFFEANLYQSYKPGLLFNALFATDGQKQINGKKDAQNKGII